VKDIVCKVPVTSLDDLKLRIIAIENAGEHVEGN
jgi:hypothetical protein